jgi:hypothetical protein
MHAAMFRRFNDAADPHPPGGRRRTRLDAGRHGRAVFRWLAGQPRLAPTFFLLVLIMEEKALALANAVGRRSRRPLDPRYVALHRVHRRDESEHVALGQRLVEAALERETPRGRRLNAVVARTLLTRWFLAPARGHDRILRRLIEEQPDAADRIAVLRTGVRGLGRTPEFMRRLYPRPVYPRTFALLDRWPVLHALRDRLESPGAEA